MPRMSRRDFLVWVAAVLGATAGARFLTACGLSPYGLKPIPAVSPEETALPATAPPPEPSASPSPSASSPSPQVTASGAPTPADLVVARGAVEPELLVRRALSALGGIERFVRPGNDVIIKPNICVAYHTYEYAATTNPWVVGALVKLCREAGARRVRVLDYPFGGEPQEAYTKSGIQEQVQAAGGEMAFMPGFEYVGAEIPAGKVLRQVKLFGDILKADLVINVPIAKTHDLAKLTLGMKNLMGVITNRPGMHDNLGQKLADLTSLIRPALTVVDAIRILTAHGPTGGDLADVKKLDTIIASPDIVAADSYAATLFGLQPRDLAYVVAGEDMGLGRSDLGALKIAQLSVTS